MATTMHPSPLPAQSTGLCLLPDWGALRVSGDDALTFLQGQATNDLRTLQPGSMGCGAFCNPKGRVIANFHIGQSGQAYVLFLSADLVEPLRQRLQMFVLRSRVKLENLAETARIAGLPASADVDASHYPKWAASGSEIWSLNDNSHRHLGLLPVSETETAGLPTLPQTAWELADIHAGFARITQATREEFLPQMLNLDWLGGIGLEKGCYTGQEIVARTHYLGQLKRRLFRFVLAGDALPAPGTPLAAGDNPAAGQVVNACADDTGNIRGLAVLTLEAANSQPLSLGDPQGPQVQIEALSPD
jgi:folate-binding protein YgfZ